ncbi:uncharacterized protein LOC100198236 [Hydra vulgaris]|uniref:Uncharacterized protein LOC100198236 n=1 Tax=Hydra vulgaris TaxID=6087 RepID=A0ABM4DDG9_HYDVU
MSTIINVNEQNGDSITEGVLEDKKTEIQRNNGYSIDEDAEFQKNTNSLIKNNAELQIDNDFLMNEGAKLQETSDNLIDNNAQYLRNSANLFNDCKEFKKKNYNEKEWYEIYNKAKSLIQRADELSKNNIYEATYVLEKIQKHILSIMKSEVKPLNNSSFVNRIKNIIEQTASEHNKEVILEFLYLCLRGHLLYELEDYEEALECYEKFENLLPEDLFKMNVKRAKGDCLRKIKRYKDALKEYKQASKVENDYYTVKIDKALLYNSRGLLYMDNQRYHKALFYFAKALKLNENPLYFCNKGIVLYKLGKNADALNALEDASKLIQQDELTDKNILYINSILNTFFRVWSCNEQFHKLISEFMNLKMASEKCIVQSIGKHRNSITSEQSIEESLIKRRSSIISDPGVEDLTSKNRYSPSLEQSIEESIKNLRNLSTYEQSEKELKNDIRISMISSDIRNEVLVEDKINSLVLEKSTEDPIKNFSMSENIIEECSTFIKLSEKFLSTLITILNQDNDISSDAVRQSKAYESKMKKNLKQISDRYTQLDLISDKIMHNMNTVVTYISHFNTQLEEQRTKLEEYITQVDKNIKATLKEYNKVLNNNLDTGLSQEIKIKITEYYKAFVGTVLSAYCSAQMMNRKWVEKRKNLMLLFISENTTEGSGRTIETLEEPLKSALSGVVSVFDKIGKYDNNVTNGRSKLAHAYDELNTLLSEDILEVVKNQNKQKQILTITMDDLNTLPDPFLKKVSCCTGFQDNKVEAFLHSTMYFSAAERLGYKDAHTLLIKYVKSSEFIKDELKSLTRELCEVQQIKYAKVVQKKVIKNEEYPERLKNFKDTKFKNKEFIELKKINNSYETSNDKETTPNQKYWYQDSKDAMNLILELRIEKTKFKDVKKKICQRAVEGYWNDTSTHFNHKSCLQLFKEKYLKQKLLKKNQSQLQDEEIEEVQMALFNFMCTAIVNNEMKNLDCITGFAKDYNELLEKIAEQHPQYFVHEKIVKAVITSDINLQIEVISKLNKINNDLDNEIVRDNYNDGYYQEGTNDVMERLLYKSKETIDQLLEFKLEVKLCRRAIKGYWNESNTLFSPKSCRELFEKKYLLSKLKKISQSEILDEEIEELQMAMFNFMCTAIINSKNKNVNCIIGFANEYPDLLKKIADQHPTYFVNQQVVNIALSSDKKLQAKVVNHLNEADNEQEENIFLYDQGWYEECNEAMDQLVKLRLEKSGIRHAKIKLCKRAVKGLWKESSVQTDCKSCKELIDKKYLLTKLKKVDQSVISDEEIEEVQMALFNFMCTSIVNYEKKKMDCIANFAKDYKELVEKIAEEHPKYFVNRRVIEVILSTDPELQSKVLRKMNF